MQKYDPVGVMTTMTMMKIKFLSIIFGIGDTKKRSKKRDIFEPNELTYNPFFIASHKGRNLYYVNNLKLLIQVK